MPTYEDLRSYFDESGYLREAAQSAAGIPIVSGFSIDVNPLWAYLYDIEYKLVPPPREWNEYYPGNFDAMIQMNADGNNSHPFLQWIKTRYQGFRRRNLYAPVPSWAAWPGSSHYHHNLLPVILTIVHRPLRTPLKGRDEERFEQEDLVRLVNLAQTYSPNIRIEERPPARLAVASGDKINAPNSGTLGGVLFDPRGNPFGVTCAHVATKGHDTYDSAGTRIGTCIAESSRVALAGGTVCDPVLLTIPNPYPGNGPDVNMLDCALIHLPIPVTRPTIAGVARSLTSGQDVTLTGAKTNITHHKLGSLCLSYCFSRGGIDYCYRDSIELLPQPRGPLGGVIGQMFTKVPVQGDSGGWVLTDEQPPAWAGLFFGEDGNRGFAIRASWVHAWAEKFIGATLNP